MADFNDHGKSYEELPWGFTEFFKMGIQWLIILSPILIITFILKLFGAYD